MLLRSVDVVRLLMRRDPTLTGTVRQRFAAAMKGLKQLEQTSTAVETVAKTAPVQPVPEPVVVEEKGQDAEPNKAKETGPTEDREVIRVFPKGIEEIREFLEKGERILFCEFERLSIFVLDAFPRN